jgi:hypothetical protein
MTARFGPWLGRRNPLVALTATHIVVGTLSCTDSSAFDPNPPLDMEIEVAALVP